MTALVVPDCSLAMAWCFEDEARPETDRILDSFSTGAQGLVPAHWHLEVANTLLRAERARRITRDQAARFVTLLGSLPLSVDPETAARGLGRTLALAQETGLTSHDAAYLELALRRGAPLATLDGPLREAAERRGVPVLGR